MVKNSKFAELFSLDFLKPYFQVTHSYIINKTKLVFFPFLYKVVLYLNHQDTNEDIYSESESSGSRDKIEFADFYLPMMSFITYILLITLNMVYMTGSQ
jgi:hypothetical protein